MAKTNIYDVTGFILDCTDAERAAVVEALKSRSAIKNAQARFIFGPGDRVTFKGRRGFVVKGVVEKVNRTTISVKTDTGMYWRVSAGALHKEE
jgi:transcription elongation factor